MNDEKIYKYYENEGFQLEKIYDQETNELKQIKVQKNEALIQRASIWAIVFDLNHERPLLLLTNTDPGVDAFCNSVMIDQNCPSEIHLLLRDGLIKKVTLTAEVDADCNSLNGLEEENQCPFDNDSSISC
jgi:hypothetical protein